MTRNVAWYHPAVASGGQELSPAGVAVVVGVFAGAGLLGYAVGGMVGAFVGATGGAFVSALVFGLQKLRQSERSLSDAPLPSLDGLEPRQQMQVMTAMIGSDGGNSFRSELLSELENIEAKARHDPEGALAAVRGLKERHPRNPAVHAELARRRFALGNTAEAVVSVGDALGCALDGGMNPMAARLFVEFAEHKEALSLGKHHYPLLGRVLRSRGESEAADWCDARTEV